MSADLSRFHRLNVADACSIWNVLSSELLYLRAKSAGVKFCCTQYVEYECLAKPRKVEKAYHSYLRQRLLKARENGDFKSYALSIEDLQEVHLLENRKKLGKGELSSMAFAKNTRQAFLTDDKGARKLANAVLGFPGCQTTPHLFGWLIFESHLTDSEKTIVIDDQKGCESWLCHHLEDAYMLALQFKLHK